MTRTVFLQNNLNLTTNENVNIILSPEFYWVRVFDIPIASKKEALNVLPNMFEEFFDIDGYKFYLEKLEDGKYLSFAYSEEKIKQAIKDSGLSLKQVSDIYFAQYELQDKNSFCIDGVNYIYQDNILVKIPQNFSLNEEFESVDIDSLKLSKHSFYINQSSKYIDNKSAYILSGLLVLFALVVFSRVYVLNDKSSSYPQQIETIKTQYKLMPTLFQTNSMLKQYKSVSKKYDKTREAIEYSINFKRSFNAVLEKVELKNNQVVVVYQDVQYSKVKNYINKKYKKAVIEQLSNKIKVRVNL